MGNDQMPHIHAFWDEYHGIDSSELWYESWTDGEDYDYDADEWNDAEGDSEDVEWADYDDFECDESVCEWVDCEEDEIVDADCWKELCEGCGAMTCQLWHWSDE